MNLLEANAEDLSAFYYRGTRAEEAAAYLRTEIELQHHVQLADLLRDYRERSVASAREISLRAAVDDLLIYYDVLEIATLSAFILPPGQSKFWNETQIILENKHVQNYYTK